MKTTQSCIERAQRDERECRVKILNAEILTKKEQELQQIEAAFPQFISLVFSPCPCCVPLLLSPSLTTIRSKYWLDARLSRLMMMIEHPSIRFREGIV